VTRSQDNKPRRAGTGTEPVRHGLVVNHLDLVELATSQVARMAGLGSLDRDDLVGEGQIALVQAACRYDPKKGGFRSFAFRRIKGAMLDALRRDSFLPRYARERGDRVVVLSMEKPVGQGGLTIADTLVDHRASVETIVEQREVLERALEGNDAQAVDPHPLTPSELEVLRGAAFGETAEQTADRLRKSIGTVRTQRRAALRRLGAKSIAQAVFLAREEIAA
jgi:RNA polymerase sigma factor (sigma-70 family)